MNQGFAAFLAASLFSANLSGPIGGLYNGVGDWLYFQGYHPRAEIEQLASPMNRRGQRLFFRTDPSLVSRQELAVRCHIPSGEPLLELGCATSDQHIYLVRIDRAELTGEERVVAAHEMLHEAYARLSGGEKKRLGALFDRAVAKISDPDLTARLKDYDHTEPGQRYNELHSILGTEYANLPPELETYYHRYFTDRGAVVASSEQFNHVFSDLAAEISALESRYHSLRTQAASDLARGDVSAYNRLVNPINTLVTAYNDKVRYYNELAQTLKGGLGGVNSQ